MMTLKTIRPTTKWVWPLACSSHWLFFASMPVDSWSPLCLFLTESALRRPWRASTWSSSRKNIFGKSIKLHGVMLLRLQSRKPQQLPLLPKQVTSKIAVWSKANLKNNYLKPRFLPIRHQQTSCDLRWESIFPSTWRLPAQRWKNSPSTVTWN